MSYTGTIIGAGGFLLPSTISYLYFLDGGRSAGDYVGYGIVILLSTVLG